VVLKQFLSAFFLKLVKATQFPVLSQLFTKDVEQSFFQLIHHQLAVIPKTFKDLRLQL